jgi:hypothetical protein
MTLAVRKLRVDDVAKLQALVVENFDAIEQGLTVLDARLLLGHATIDVIGVDAGGTLVLGAVGFSANEEMLLRAVETYSWCLEYPESLMRHYPSCEVSEDRPPRLLFVVERVPDAFHRKIKQLGFPEVDCVEVRHLEFDGVAAVYFETLLRLRRGPARVIESDAPSAPVADIASEARPAVAARPTTMKLQKLLNADAPATPRASERTIPVREHAPVVSMVSRQSVVTARVERPRPAPEPVILPEPEPLMPEPVAEPEPVALIVPAVVPVEPQVAVVEPTLPSLAVVEPEPEKISLRDLAELTLETMAPVAPSAPAPKVIAEAEEVRVSFKDLAAALLGESPAPGVVEEPVLVLEPRVEETAALVVEPLVAEPLVIEPLVIEPEAPALTVEALIASATPPVQTPAAPVAEPAKPQMALPQEFAGLNFPNDGVLTRQWMEFLNQMSSSK